MTRFKAGDVFCHINDTNENVKYCVHFINDERGFYKVQRLDTKSIEEIPISREDNYVATESPTDSYVYQLGQVLLKKQGTPRIGVIFDIVPSPEDKLNEYEIALYDPKGNYVQTALYRQEEVLEDFEIRNFRWVVEHGDPKGAIQRRLEKLIEAHREKIVRYNTILKNLVYFETEMEKNGEAKEAEKDSNEESQEG